MEEKDVKVDKAGELLRKMEKRIMQLELAAITASAVVDTPHSSGGFDYIWGGDASNPYIGIFDISEITYPGAGQASITVALGTKTVCLGGVWLTVTVDGGSQPLTPITDGQYIYIKVDRSDSTAVLAKGTLPDNTDTLEHFPLWYIGITDNVIDTSTTVKLRSSAIHVTTWSS